MMKTGIADMRVRMMLGAGLALVVVGLVVGFWPHHVGSTVSGGGVNCGSAFHENSDSIDMATGTAQYYNTLAGTLDISTDYATTCDRARSSAKPLAYGALGLGIVALGGAVVIWPREQQPQEA